jgi:sulfide:quinone oxidoreductase
MSHSVVILGAGVGGLVTGARLRELLPPEDTITVVDRDASSVQGLSLLWVMRGWRGGEQVRVTPSALDRQGITFLQAQVDAIRPEAQRVDTSAGELAYDALVLALGATVKPAMLPGLPEAIAAGRAGEFYTLDGAARLYQQLTNLRQGRLVVMIARLPFKCPAAPYEGALLAADLLVERGVRDAVEVEVLTPEPQPMPVAGPVVGRALTSMLAERDIPLRTQTTVERVDGQELIVDSGERVPFDLLMVIPPHQAPEPVKRAGFSEPGWVPVDARTLRTSTDGVWALGDVSSITLTNGKPLPKASVFAKGEAEAVAAGVARHLGYQAPEPFFDGHGYCYIELGSGVAAKGEGNFLEASGPAVELAEPSPAFHREKEQEEQDWIRQWNAPVSSPQS